jgi:hypothetical protein
MAGWHTEYNGTVTYASAFSTTARDVFVLPESWGVDTLDDETDYAYQVAMFSGVDFDNDTIFLDMSVYTGVDDLDDYGALGTKKARQAFVEKAYSVRDFVAMRLPTTLCLPVFILGMVYPVAEVALLTAGEVARAIRIVAEHPGRISWTTMTTIIAEGIDDTLVSSFLNEA